VIQTTFSPDGSRVATASEDFTAIVWDAVTGQRLTSPLRHHNQVQSAVFSPDGQWVATASWDQTARIWSARTGNPLTPSLHHPVALYKIQFLQDGQHVVASSQTGRKWLSLLPSDERPVEDVILHADLLSGGMADSGPRFRKARPESVRAMWEHLRTNYPNSFSTPKEELISWHEAQANENDTLSSS
jgi:WD40 repeat protein